jgi:hypothetical protein
MPQCLATELFFLSIMVLWRGERFVGVDRKSTLLTVWRYVVDREAYLRGRFPRFFRDTS